MIWYIVGFELVEMAISTIPKPTTVVRNLYENARPGVQKGAAVHKIICKLAFNLKPLFMMLSVYIISVSDIPFIE